jgi:hypothetical protein
MLFMTDRTRTGHNDLTGPSCSSHRCTVCTATLVHTHTLDFRLHVYVSTVQATRTEGSDSQIRYAEEKMHYAAGPRQTLRASAWLSVQASSLPHTCTRGHFPHCRYAWIALVLNQYSHTDPVFTVDNQTVLQVCEPWAHRCVSL